MILRTKRKIIKDPHGYSVGKITSKNGKGFHSTTESFESVKSFCESAWLDGFTVYAQKMYVESVNPDDGRTATPPTTSTEPVNPDLQGTDRRAPSSNNDKEKKAKSWWESLSEKEKKWIKGALIAAGTGVTLAAAYKMYKSSHENDDPKVQKAYSEAFMDGFDYYTEKYFSC
jgi:hypothetical protein